MPRPGVPQKEIYAAADRITARGERPSVAAVRAELGDRGSNSTILRHLQEWWDCHSAAKVEPALAIPEPLAKAIKDALDSTWAVASKIAADEIATARQTALKRNEHLEIQFRDAVGTIDQLEATIDGLQADLESTRSQLDTARDQLLARQSELSALRSQMEENQTRAEALIVDRLAQLWSEAMERQSLATEPRPNGKANSP